MRPRATFSSVMGLAAESMTGGSALKTPSLAESTATPGLRLVQAAPSMRKAHNNNVARRRMSSSVNEYTPSMADDRVVPSVKLSVLATIDRPQKPMACPTYRSPDTGSGFGTAYDRATTAQTVPLCEI